MSGGMPADLTHEFVDKLILQKQQGPVSLGTYPDEGDHQGQAIYVRVGPFGPYVQLGEQTDDKKPKRVGVPKNMDSTTLTLDQALALLHLPKRLGHHPETGKVVNAGVGRFGPYVQHDGVYKSFGKDGTATVGDKKYDVLTVDLPTAVEMLKDARKRGQTPPLRELGPHPEDKAQVQVFEGRFGPYVKHGGINANIPKDLDVQDVTLEQAVVWLAERAAKGPPKGRGRRGARGVAPKAATKKSPAPKKAATEKKAAAPKKAAKKAKKASGAKKTAKKKSAPKKG
jgi:DNA topoisomerase-1